MGITGKPPEAHGVVGTVEHSPAVVVMAPVLVLVVVRREEAGVREVAAIDFSLFLEEHHPCLRPLPLGIPVKTNLVMFGRFY